MTHSDGNESFSQRGVWPGDGGPIIGLAINGDDLVLNGRFDHWTPVGMQQAGDESAAHLLFDVTGTRGAGQGGELFTFAATDVQRMGDQAYIAKGTMRRGEVELPVDAVVQTPGGHTPFVAVTFHMEQKSFPEVWSDLSALIALPAESGGQMVPRAWPREPTIASA